MHSTDPFCRGKINTTMQAETLLNRILKWKLKRISSFLAIIFIVYCGIVFLLADTLIARFDVTDHKVTRRYDRFSPTWMIEDNLKRWMETDKGTGCVMPKLDAFAPEMMVFEWAVPPIDCKSKNWVVCKRDQCQLDSVIKRSYSNVYCSYRDIIYLADEDVELGTPLILSETEVYRLRVSDFIQVSCGGTDIYGMWSNWTGRVAGLRPLHRNITNKGTGQPERYSILVFAFDSTARNGFVRKMPRSYAVLTEELGAVLMDGYNIVGDGTSQAVIPMLTGYSEYELPEIRKSVLFRDLYFVDSYPFIWYLLERNGYKTGYLEDSPEYGTFTNRYTGFAKQPTDLYGHALVQQSKWEGDRDYCISGLPIHEVFMDLTEQFMNDSSNHRFIFTFSGLPHDNHNMLRAADYDFASWLQRLKEQGFVQDTVLFVMGDHGPRHGGNRNTVQGRLEERLPFMAIVLPERLKRSHPEMEFNLAKNAHVLTTPYDLHATFLHIAGLREHAINVSVPGAELRRSLSLLEQIPETRSCTEAGIQQSWCACVHWRPVPSYDTLSLRLADELVNFINVLTQFERKHCALRELMRIEWVKEISPRKDLMVTVRNEKPNYFKRKFVETLNTDYQIKVTLQPGESTFEATLTYDLKSDTISTNEYSISRTSTYGDEPRCIRRRRPDLDKCCYCYRESIWNR